MAANPLGPQQVQPVAPVQHAQFGPNPVTMLGTQLAGNIANKGINRVGNRLWPAAGAATTAPAAAGAAGAAAPLAAGAAAPLAAGAAGAAAPAAAGLGGALGAGAAGAAGAGAAGLGAAGAGLAAAAAPIAAPFAIGAGLGKLFGLFKEGGRVPSETMTAMEPQKAPQPQTPLSFKQLEQQQSLSLKKQAFDADERRKEEAHRIKMAQQQLKLSEAEGLRTPLSAP